MTTLVFGGTFDPPHRRHVEIARRAADLLGAERILVIPASINPQRRDQPPAPGADRLAMTRLAFRDEPRADVLDLELRREGPSYTIDTLRELERLGGSSFRLLVGSDQALNLPSWRSWREVVERAEPAIVLRPPHTDGAFARAAATVFGDDAAAWIRRVLPIEPVDLRSTDCRASLSAGSEDPGLDPEVAAYARTHLLYRDP